MLSRSFIKCALSKIANATFIPLEDVATGVLAEQCGIKCRSDDWAGPTDSATAALVSHPIQVRDQIVLNWHEAWKSGKM
jgi:hypothetical protein